MLVLEPAVEPFNFDAPELSFFLLMPYIRRTYCFRLCTAQRR